MKTLNCTPVQQYVLPLKCPIHTAELVYSLHIKVVVSYSRVLKQEVVGGTDITSR